MSTEEELGIQLSHLWEMQKRYNECIGKITPRDSPARWSEVLLLGMITEVNELLKEISWKRHRGDTTKPSKISRSNLSVELGDLTKYVLSLWQIWGFDAEQMLTETIRKSYVMDMKLKQEFQTLPLAQTEVLLVDLDGTLACLRYGLWEHAKKAGIIDARCQFVNPETLNADVDLKINYRTFQKMKEEFTEQEGYLHLLPMQAACTAVRKLLQQGVHVIASTARPADKYPRLWLETWAWLEDQGLGAIKQLYIGDDARIKILLDLAERGCKVVLFDDDPNTVERGLNSGIKAVVPRYPYNAHLWRRAGVYPVDSRNGRVTEAFAKAGITGKSAAKS